MKFFSFHPRMKFTCKENFFHPGTSFILGWDFILATCTRTLTAYTFLPRQNFIPGWTYPYPKGRDEISSWDEKKKKQTYKHFIPGLDFTMSMFYLIFDACTQWSFGNLGNGMLASASALVSASASAFEYKDMNSMNSL